MSKTPKRFGLIVPGDTKKVAPIACFNNDSSEEEPVTDWVKNSLSHRRKQGCLDIEKALKDDPTVYQYDEIYDDMQNKKMEDVQSKQNKDRKPRYIQMLMNQAGRRKKENERRVERQIQKERIAEGDEFTDKETFITLSYKKKLEEMKKLDEEEQRMDMLEQIGDVCKQQDMTGFYRHLYRTTTESSSNIMPSQNNNKTTVTTSLEVTSPNNRKESVNSNIRLLDYDQSVNEDKIAKRSRSIPKQVEINKRTKKENTTRQYRRQKSESTDSDDEGSRKVVESEKNTNLDSDTSLSSSSSENDEDLSGKPEMAYGKMKECDSAKGKNTIADIKDNNPVEESVTNSGITAVENKINRRLIWEKRTIGDVFDSAVQRYFQRKANRIDASNAA